MAHGRRVVVSPVRSSRACHHSLVARPISLRRRMASHLITARRAMGERTTHLRIAAIGDIHVSKSAQGKFQALFTQISGCADVLVLCGDFTDYGLPDEARILARELTAAAKIPPLARLGNPASGGGEQDAIRQTLTKGGGKVVAGEVGVEVGGGVVGG